MALGLPDWALYWRSAGEGGAGFGFADGVEHLERLDVVGLEADLAHADAGEIDHRRLDGLQPAVAGIGEDFGAAGDGGAFAGDDRGIKDRLDLGIGHLIGREDERRPFAADELEDIARVAIDEL